MNDINGKDTLLVRETPYKKSIRDEVCIDDYRFNGLVQFTGLHCNYFVLQYKKRVPQTPSLFINGLLLE